MLTGFCTALAALRCCTKIKMRARRFAAVAAPAHLKRCPTASRHWQGTVFANAVEPQRICPQTTQNAFRFLQLLLYAMAARTFFVGTWLKLRRKQPKQKMNRRTSTSVTFVIVLASFAVCPAFAKNLASVFEFVACPWHCYAHRA